MQTRNTSFAFFISHLLLFCCFVNGDATDQACGGSASWVPGGVYGISMSRFIPNYSTNTATCRMTISGGNGPYSPGQEFTATLTSTSSLGMKIESTGGATMSTFSSTPTRVNTAKNCADYNSRKTTVTFKLKAPLKGGKIAVQGLCGNENTVFVSNVLEILPGANVPPADGPGGKSSDPNFDIEIALDSNLKLFYRRTGNQLNVKMTLSKIGYVSLALGRSMVPAVAIVGLDPAANPGSPGVGIYELKGKSGANSQISPLISNAQTLTSTFGVSNAKFTSTGGSSVLEFSIDVTKQDAKFTLTGSGPVDTTWAYGGSAYGDHGPSRGSLSGVDFSSADASSIPVPTNPTNPPPSSNTPSGTTTSSDKNFDLEVPLSSKLRIFYRRAGDLLNVKMVSTQKGYVSLALGKKMVPAVAIVGLDSASNSGLPAIGIYRLESRSGSVQQVSPLLSADLASFGISNAKFTSNAAGGGSTLEFSIDVTKQRSEFALTGSGPVDTTWAIGNVVYGDHGADRGDFHNVDFSSLASPGGVSGSGFDLSLTLFLHAIFMILAWSILSPLGTILPLLNNGKHGRALMKLSQPVWYKFHLYFQLGAFVFGTIGFVTGVIYMSNESKEHFSGSHELLGLAVFLGSLFQPIHGYFRPPKTKTGHRPSVSRKMFDYAHPLIGFFCVFAGIADCLTGVVELDIISGSSGTFQLGGLAGNLGFGGFFGIVSVISAVLFLPGIIYGIIRSPHYMYYLRSRKNNSTLLVNPGSSFRGRDFSSMEVAKHSRENDFFVIYKGKVYDVSKFLDSHPGGKRIMLPFAGRDMTSEFLNVGHSETAVSMLQQYYVGELFGSSNNSRGSSSSSEPQSAIPVNMKILLQSNQEKYQVMLARKKRISPNSYQFVFAFQNPNLSLGLPIGKHICIWTKDGRTMRKYTPTRSNDTGSFTLVVKVYPNGIMSNYLARLGVGELITIAGPFGSTEYVGSGIFTKSGKQITSTAVRHVGMVAGGSGITPILQIMNGILNEGGNIHLSILYVNSTLDDILLQEELFSIALGNKNQVSLWFSLSKPPTQGWKYSVGRVDATMLKQHVLPKTTSNSVVIICGPEGMMNSTKQLLINQLGYPSDKIIEY